MIQFYFLSIFLNCADGLILITDGEEGVNHAGFSLRNETVRLILGILSILVAILKLLSPMRGIVILGDLLPVLVGGAAGFVFIYEYYLFRTTLDQEKGRLNWIFLKHKKAIGFIAILTGILHFLFAEVPLL
jgi:uncharacterized membrane protein HdeD (DUF308 family)